MIRRLRIAALVASLGVAGGVAAVTLPAHASTPPTPTPSSLVMQQNSNGYPLCVAVMWLNWGDCFYLFHG